jgi:hypothetical protein
MGSVWLAIIYIGGWILSMRIFGYFWKNRKLGELSVLLPHLFTRRAATAHKEELEVLQEKQYHSTTAGSKGY